HRDATRRPWTNPSTVPRERAALGERGLLRLGAVGEPCNRAEGTGRARRARPTATHYGNEPRVSSLEPRTSSTNYDYEHDYELRLRITITNYEHDKLGARISYLLTLSRLPALRGAGVGELDAVEQDDAALAGDLVAVLVGAAVLPL